MLFNSGDGFGGGFGGGLFSGDGFDGFGLLFGGFFFGELETSFGNFSLKGTEFQTTANAFNFVFFSEGENGFIVLFSGF